MGSERRGSDDASQGDGYPINSPPRYDTAIGGIGGGDRSALRCALSDARNNLGYSLFQLFETPAEPDLWPPAGWQNDDAK